MPNHDDLVRMFNERWAISPQLGTHRQILAEQEPTSAPPPTSPSPPTMEVRIATLESRVNDLQRSLAEMMEMYRGLGSSRAREQQMNASITELGREVQRLRALVEPSVSVGVAPAADTPSLDDLVGRRIRFTPPHVGVGESRSEAWENLRETYEVELRDESHTNDQL